MARFCTVETTAKAVSVALVIVLFCTGFAQLVIGGVFYGKCPFNDLLITYNITSGVVTVAMFVFFGVITIVLFHNNGVGWISGAVIIVFIIIGIITTLFLFSWTIFGNTVTVWQSNYTTIDQNDAFYCHPTLALSSFILMILYSVAFYLFLIALCLLRFCQDK